MRSIGVYQHMCPGCKQIHEIDAYDDDSAHWYFNGNVDYPTFEPKVRIHKDGKLVCEYDLIKGNLIFRDTCLHEFAGKTIPLPIYTL